MEALVFAFASFVFYKAISAFMFWESPSLVYCAVMAIITMAIVLTVGAYFNMRTRRLTLEWGASDTAAPVGSFLLSVFGLPALMATIINMILGFLTVFGFSEDFADDTLYSGYYSGYDEGAVSLFAILLAVPPLSFFLFQAWRARSALRDMERS